MYAISKRAVLERRNVWLNGLLVFDVHRRPSIWRARRWRIDNGMCYSTTDDEEDLGAKLRKVWKSFWRGLCWQ